MPWRTRTVMDERARFVFEARNPSLSFSELCRRYAISRPTGYKWLQRYERERLEGLADRSHRPASCPHATPPKVVERILELRKQRGWGARKLRAVIEREFGYAPAADTIRPISRASSGLWMASSAIRSPSRTDTPGFASNALGRLSQLSVYFVTLGITPQFIEPGKPQQNGRHERMHRTLKRETAKPPRASLAAQQRRFRDFRGLYNHERPHEALGQSTPASLYRPSLRPFPNRLPEITYPPHFEIRLVSQDSTIRWKS